MVDSNLAEEDTAGFALVVAGSSLAAVDTVDLMEEDIGLGVVRILGELGSLCILSVQLPRVLV